MRLVILETGNKDETGNIRVGGRLAQSSLPYNEKHPILLSKDSQLLYIIISHYHERVHHQGRTITLNAIRGGGFYAVGLTLGGRAGCFDPLLKF